jgi:NADH dehydrogenase FAD-containing subunit
MFAALKGATNVLVVGGGTLGVELAGEVLTDYPDKKVTLVHSRDRLLPDMSTRASAAALGWLKKHGCQVGVIRGLAGLPVQQVHLVSCAIKVLELL